MKTPVDLLPVLAKIEVQGSLGLSSWYEVVYYNDTVGEWESFSGSNTFLNGEKVVGWTYVKDIEMENK